MAAIGQLTGRITTMTIARVGYRLSREASQKVEADVAAEAIAAFRAKADELRQAVRLRRLRGARGERRDERAAARADADGRACRRRRAAPADALSVEPGKALVTATVNGTVQMK